MRWRVCNSFGSLMYGYKTNVIHIWSSVLITCSHVIEIGVGMLPSAYQKCFYHC
jgi:hypothetical protein